MYKIKSKIKNGGIWDGKKLVRFENGEIETNDTKLAEKAHATDGFTVTGEADKPSVTAAPEHLKGMDIEGLKAYAAANNIDIGAATSEAGILKKIAEAEASR